MCKYCKGTGKLQMLTTVVDCDCLTDPYVAKAPSSVGELLQDISKGIDVVPGSSGKVIRVSGGVAKLTNPDLDVDVWDGILLSGASLRGR